MAKLSKNGWKWIFPGAFLLIIILLSETPQIFGENRKITGNQGIKAPVTNQKPQPFEFKPDPANPYPACKEAIEKARLYKEVIEVLHPWTLRSENQSKDLPDAIKLVCRCFRSLNRNSELDAYLEKVIEVLSKNWRDLENEASFYEQNCHQGTFKNGVFIRDSRLFGNKLIFSHDRDRVQALQLMADA